MDVDDSSEGVEDEIDNCEVLAEQVPHPIKVEREVFEDFDDIQFLLSEENSTLPKPLNFKQEDDIDQLANLILCCEEDFIFPQPKICIKVEVEDDTPFDILTSNDNQVEIKLFITPINYIKYVVVSLLGDTSRSGYRFIGRSRFYFWRYTIRGKYRM